MCVCVSVGLLANLFRSIIVHIFHDYPKNGY